MPTKWNLIGRKFTHKSGGHTGKCGTHGKLPKKIEWSFNMEGKDTFYVDWEMIRKLEDDVNTRKFAWLLESKSIYVNLFLEIKEKREELFETYEAIFTHNQELLQLDPRFRHTICCGSWIKDIKVHPKTKLVSAISSGKNMCEGHRWRNDFIHKNRDRFDLYGNSYKHLKYKEMGLNEYMFSVAIENGSYSSYFTEKILDCFATGTIPIYRGSPDIGDYFNTDGIIFIDDNFSFDQLNADLYYSKIDAVVDNLNRFKKSYHCAEDYIFETYKDEFGW